jgi:cystathionine beta-lyase
MYALIGAYTKEGEAWLEELRKVLTENIDYACTYIRSHFPGVECFRPQGTYMLFLDCTQWCKEHGLDIDTVEKRAWSVGVAVQDGRMFHGPCHLRLNLALPKSRVEEAFQRLSAFVFK